MRILFCLLFMLAGWAARGQSHYLFVGTYTNKGSNTADPPKDSTGSKGIYVFRLDVRTGHAVLLSHTEGVVNPSYLTLSADGSRLYAATDTRTVTRGSVSAFVVDQVKGRLQLIDRQLSGGDNPVYVAIHPGGRWVALANYTGGSLSLYPVRADGGLGPYVFNRRFEGHSVNPTRQDRSHVHSAVFSPDGHYLYVQDLGQDKVMIYRCEMKTATGQSGERSEKPLQLVDSVTAVPGSGPRHLTFSPNRKFAYLVEEMGGHVDVYRYHPENGHLDSLQRIAAHPTDAKGPFRGADIHASPDGRFLYATNREAESNIAIFAIDPVRGTLRTVGYEPVLGKEPRNFTIDPTGRWLLAANQESNEIVIFHRDPVTGRLKPTDKRLSVPAPTCLRISE